MNIGYEFDFCGARLTALGSGALWWADHGLLCVSDLHLGKAERIARRGGTALPPYETMDTLTRLAATGCLSILLDPTSSDVQPAVGKSDTSSLVAKLLWVEALSRHLQPINAAALHAPPLRRPKPPITCTLDALTSRRAWHRLRHSHPVLGSDKKMAPPG